jgi:hypothetical protein
MWSTGNSISSRSRARSARRVDGPFHVKNGVGRFDWRRIRNEQPSRRSASSPVSKKVSRMSNSAEPASEKFASSAGTSRGSSPV